MLPFADGKRDVYGPDALQVICTEFDAAVQLLPPNLKEHERARRRLALLILQQMDRGEPAGKSWESSRARFPENDSIASPSRPRPGSRVGIDRRRERSSASSRRAGTVKRTIEVRITVAGLRCIALSETHHHRTKQTHRTPVHPRSPVCLWSNVVTELVVPNRMQNPPGVS